MRTTHPANAKLWSCNGPKEFDTAMVRAHPELETSTRNTWDTINVTRNAYGLGSLSLLRQCFQLWEDEMEKWGCNGLGEELSGKMFVSTHRVLSHYKAHQDVDEHELGSPSQPTLQRRRSWARIGEAAPFTVLRILESLIQHGFIN